MAFSLKGPVKALFICSILAAAQRERLLQDATCDDASRWSQMPWEFLSFQERASWSTLGWTREMWDAAHPIATSSVMPVTTTFGRRLDDFQPDEWIDAEVVLPDSDAGSQLRRLQMGSPMPTTTSTTVVPVTESSCYQDLTEAQQDAVRTLAYSITTWHLCKNPSCSWPDGIPEPNAPCLEVLAWFDSSLYSRTWVDLTDSKRSALELLGWASSRWVQMDFPLSYAQLWSELQPRQQEAATFLGYSVETWERCERAAPCITRLELLETKWSTISWREMQQPFQDRLKELGYDEKRWTNGDGATLKKAYVDLTDAETISVRLAGYVSDTWDGCPDAQCEERFSYLKRKYSDIQWSALTVAERRAWQLLGHTENLWLGGMMNTVSMQLTWDELSLEQRAQAEFLGFSMGTWQGCNDNWGQDTGNNTQSDDFISSSIERTVRSRMVIRRPFAEVSGNVYGSAVDRLPTSFIQVFEEAIARALFCSNPPLSEDPSTYVDTDGNPLCIQKGIYETQRHRVKVMTVVEGSIIVDFFLARNQTVTELPAPALFESLRRMLELKTSPLCQDMHFGKFAQVAHMEEIPLSLLSEDELAKAAVFEVMRNQYGPETACQLLSDAREGPVKCPTTTSAASTTGGSIVLLLLRMLFSA
ncbi:hypothetical protein AK812_SmicGene30866 [Symbiodinium microadriaticum]|uniref:Uncharacterized protein n=1 Tax=Symbiodinium microadriaticum TaxID=2951 RepID=A0A1Q9CY93_SYMMI|nr:hypothetical protein AK812_SmicGene30866 [Symbiodinium microadriaticum]